MGSHRLNFRKFGTPLVALALAGTLSGCGGTSEYFSRDAEWLSGRNSLFKPKSLTIDNQALTSTRPVSPEDLVSADGTCLGMTPPASPVDSNAQAQPADLQPGAQPGGPGLGAGAPQSVGVALGMSECEVARSEGIASNVVIGAAASGDREVTLTYLTGVRPGIYRFTGGRLTSIERAPEPPKPEKPARKPRKKKQG